MEREGITAPRDTLETRLSTLEAAERVKIAAEKALKEAEERMVRLSKVSASPSGPMPEPAPAKLAPRPPPPKQQQAPTPPQEPRRARTKAEMLERQSSCCGLCTESEEAFLWRKLAAMEDWELKASVDLIYRPERHTCFGLYIESKKKFEARNDLWKRLPAACHRWIVPA